MSVNGRESSLHRRHPHSNTPSAVDSNPSISIDKSTLPLSYFSPNAERARAEKLLLGWGVVWISLMTYIVVTRWFESFTPYHYLCVGLLLFLIPSLFPFLFPHYCGCDSSLPWSRWYFTKANLYIAVLSWNANYFWTHYFYTVLRATYTFKAHRLNEVPFALYLITHSYFHLYHVLASIMLRVIWRLVGGQVTVRNLLIVGGLILISSYIVAFLEAFTLENFPYYDIPDRSAMYLYGSIFYALYFCVSFPMFARLDEEKNSWTLGKTFVDSMAASMIITQLLDFWRIGIGRVTDKPAANPPQQSLPFVY